MFYRHPAWGVILQPRTLAGAAFGCAGTPGFHSPSPNDIWNAAAWSMLGSLAATAAQADPLGGATATKVVATSGGGAFSGWVENVGPFTLNSGTTYTFDAYFKSIAGPSWVLFQTTDGTANAFGNWFDLSGSGTVGNPNAGGAGNALTCAQIAPSTNGYVRVSIGGHLAATNTGMRINTYFVDGNGSGLVTLNQEIYFWQVSP